MNVYRDEIASDCNCAVTILGRRAPELWKIKLDRKTPRCFIIDIAQFRNPTNESGIAPIGC